MQKKFVLFVAILCASLLHAQGTVDPYVYTSGAPAPEMPIKNINHTPNNEPTYSISIHPMSTFLLSIAFSPVIYLTFEGNLNSHMSLITRPHYARFEDENYIVSTIINEFGISEGLRFYLSRDHKGFFTAFHVEYNYVNLKYRDYFFEGRDSFDASAHSLGLFAYIGAKARAGFFTSSFDVGLGYGFAFASAETKDKAEAVRDSYVGVIFDMNWSIGFAF